MPYVKIEITREGTSREQKATLIKGVTDLISEVKPHIYAKGGDYTPESLDRDEYNALVEAGSKIEILSLVPGRSTTNIINKMASDCGAKKL